MVWGDGCHKIIEVCTDLLTMFQESKLDPCSTLELQT